MASRTSKPPAVKFSKPTGSWGPGRRLEFIDFRLRWEGQFNRSDLVEHFGISVPQASADIASYMEMAPANLAYDRSARVYVATAEFVPVFATSAAEHYLKDLLALSTGAIDSGESFIGKVPDVAVAVSPSRAVPANVLVWVVQAIRCKEDVEVLYQSMSRSEPMWRRIAPHALGYDGFRWHIRAFCHSRGAFRDFVFPRVLEIRACDEHRTVEEKDVAWHSKVKLILVPASGLGQSKRKVVELDYAMSGGQVVLETRQAMLYYVLQRLGLSRDSVLRPEAQQIRLENFEEVKAILEGLAKSYE